MADTFFGFESSINHGDHLSSQDDCLETEEEEYDALNDETFGALEDNGNVDDWEQQHEQFAEIAEINRQSEQLESSLNQLVLEDHAKPKDGCWTYNWPNKNGGIFNSTVLPNLEKISKSLVESNDGSKTSSKLHNRSAPAPFTNSSPNSNHGTRRICTVEELERGLLKNRVQKHPGPPTNVHHPHPFLFQQAIPGRLPLPPGLHHPMGMNPPIRPMNVMPPLPNLPPGFKVVPPHFMHGHGGPMHPPPGMVYPHNASFPVNHPYNFPPPPRHLNAQNFQQPNRSFPRRNEINNKHRQEDVHRDEYAGLMTNREKQWLLNIQLMQLNTGTPYFDDYYYTVFKERKTRSEKEDEGYLKFVKSIRYVREGPQGHHRNDRQENTNTLAPRVYTVLQFENSLGKLQCGSVTAPRKIIDMDVVTLDKDTEVSTAARDTRKTKQLLLELESLYTLMLKGEDLKNPLAIFNMDSLRQIKEKQRLRELDTAATTEQKMEVLKLLQQGSWLVKENQNDYFTKVITGLLQEDKFASFMNIRKGKVLLLRIMPYLKPDSFPNQLLEVWMKILLSMPAVGRRDTLGDNIFPKLHPYYKRFIQTCKMSDILEIVTSLIEVIRPDNSRSTPLSHQGRSPLHFVTSNKFGVSCLVTTLVRSEYLISSGNATENQQSDWSTFVVNWAETVGNINSVATPLELIPLQIFNKHCVRIANLTAEKKSLLQKFFVDTN